MHSFLIKKPVNDQPKQRAQKIGEVPSSGLGRSIEEPDGHLLLHVGPLQGAAELIVADHLVVVRVRLYDGALCDAGQLLFAGRISNACLFISSARKQNCFFCTIEIGLIKICFVQYCVYFWAETTHTHILNECRWNTRYRVIDR